MAEKDLASGIQGNQTIQSTISTVGGLKDKTGTDAYNKPGVNQNSNKTIKDGWAR